MASGRALRHPAGGQLVLVTRRLELTDFARLEAEGLEVTTCDFGRPHWAISAEHAEGEEVPRNPIGFDVSGEPIGPTRSFLMRLRGVRFRLWDRAVLPLPPLTWDTYWNTVLPIRSVAYSRSSKFGHRAEVVWNGNLLLPRFLKPYVDLGLRTELLSRRGFGYGADLEIGEDPARWTSAIEGTIGDTPSFELYGRGVAFAISDRARDRGDIEPDTENRYRVRYHQRLRLPTSTLLDLEVATESDRNFLNEYYQGEVQGQKVPENILYLRQPIADDVSVTLLGKTRLANYRTVVEELPELAVHVIEKPLWRTGLYGDVVARGTNIRYHPDNDTALGSRRMLRGDIVSVLSTVVGDTRYGRLRPFFEVRGTTWEQDEIRRNTIERLTLATGATLGWHLGRTYSVGRGESGERWRHVVEPDITYRNVFENNVDPSELFPFDATESVTRSEVVTFGVRQYLLSRRPRREGERFVRARKIAESELEIDYFPDPGRDHAGDPWGPIRGELLVWPIEGVGAFVDGAYDVEVGGRFEEFNTGLTFRIPTPGAQYLHSDRRIELTVANRFRKHLSHSLSWSGRWKVSESYELGLYLEEDLRRRRAVNQLYTIARHFHRWTCALEVEVDEGENDVGVHVQFTPRDLISLTRRH
ncbi:MAG: hypothetical protein KDC38_06260 [Planctomycetes bacterium]|nr:hypothetical protein [Planctomycetota bacterium]